VRALRGERDRERERGGEAGARAGRRRRLAPAPRHEHRDEQEQPRGAGHRERRREREPVDVRARDHGSPRNEWPLTAAGHAERTRRRATSGTTTASSAPRRSSAASVTAGPGSSCSTAEIRRSMYIAARTIATAPTTAQPHPCWKTPARIRNSPAKLDERGTASATIPVVIRTVASAGRPRAIPPSSASSPVAARRSTMPASRKSVVEIRPWFTICSTEPSKPRSFAAKSPYVIRPICASDEYATTPRKSGARNASSEP